MGNGIDGKSQICVDIRRSRTNPCFKTHNLHATLAIVKRKPSNQPMQWMKQKEGLLRGGG